jgi:hypothetical protein
MHRAQQVYEVLAQCGIRYVHEPTSSEAGRQTIRPLDQELTGPRQATCLDIAVTFSGACLDAGLHPVVVTLDSARGGPGHALVLVWLDGSAATRGETSCSTRPRPSWSGSSAPPLISRAVFWPLT